MNEDRPDTVRLVSDSPNLIHGMCIAAAIFSVPLFIMWWFAPVDDEFVMYPVLALLMVPVFLALQRLVIAGITLTEETLTIKPAVGAERTIPRRHLARGIYAQKYLTGAEGAEGADHVARFFLLDHQDQCVLHTGGEFRPRQIEQLIRGLHPLPVTRLTEFVDSEELERQAPGSLPRWETRPKVVAGVALAVFVTLLAGISALFIWGFG